LKLATCDRKGRLLNLQQGQDPLLLILVPLAHGSDTVQVGVVAVTPDSWMDALNDLLLEETINFFFLNLLMESHTLTNRSTVSPDFSN